MGRFFVEGIHGRQGNGVKSEGNTIFDCTTILVSGLACRVFESHHSILTISKKLNKLEKSTVFLRSLREVREQGKPQNMQTENNNLPSINVYNNQGRLGKPEMWLTNC